MGLGSTTKKLQLVAERAEQMYKQVGELRDQITELRTTVETTSTRVEELDRRSEQQWVLLKTLAEQQDIDVDAVLTEAAIDEVPAEEASSDDTDDDLQADEDADGDQTDTGAGRTDRDRAVTPDQQASSGDSDSS